MKTAVAKGLIFLVILAAFYSPETVTAGDKLPLKHGLYVLEGEKCPQPGEKPATASLVFYDGKGISIFYDGNTSDKHSKSTIINVRNKGKVYYITQQSADNIITPGKDHRNISHSTITIKSYTSFSISDIRVEGGSPDKETLTFRFCRPKADQ